MPAQLKSVTTSSHSWTLNGRWKTKNKALVQEHTLDSQISVELRGFIQLFKYNLSLLNSEQFYTYETNINYEQEQKTKNNN